MSGLKSGARRRPLPVPTRETRPFWQSASRGVLALPQCVSCGALLYPPPPRCPHCLKDELRWTDLSGKGRLLSWTTIRTDLSAGIEAPFTIAEIELVEQVDLIVVGLLVGTAADDLRAGVSVRVTFAPSRAEDIAYPQFEVDQAEASGKRS